MRTLNDYLNLTTADALQRVKKEYDDCVVVYKKRINKTRKPGAMAAVDREEAELAPEPITRDENIF